MQYKGYTIELSTDKKFKITNGSVLPRLYSFYPDVDKVRNLLAEKKRLRNLLNICDHQLAKFEITGNRKPSYGLHPEQYPKYIKNLIDEYEKKANL